MNRTKLLGSAAAVVVTVTGGACAGNSSKVAAAAPRATAALSEWSVTLSSSTFRAGKYAFTIKNDGKIEHELIAVRTTVALADLPLKADGDVNEEDPSVPNSTDGDNIASGKTQARTITLTPGTYVYMCNLPGHFKAGMHELITVTA